jgi:pimeloyl-ACP methyl ester carboxylesterase
LFGQAVNKKDLPFWGEEMGTNMRFEYDPSASSKTVSFKTIEVDGLNIAYREAGDPKNPKLVLLHGFPSSSHQYRNLMRELADSFHVVSPDYPGFGNSDMPDPKSFAYTFDNTAVIVTKFLEKVGFTRFGLYVQDYGGPVGFRILDKHPDWLEWLIIQNTNAYEIGFTEVWSGLRTNYWKGRSVEAEKAIAGFLEPPTVYAVYTTGHPNPELISPDNWNMDNHFLERPNAKQVQLDFFYDYRTNVELYPKWQAFLKDHQPKTIIFWGQGDIFFTPAGGEAFLEVLPKAEMHRLNSGHFAVEDCLGYIANHMQEFYQTKVSSNPIMH